MKTYASAPARIALVGNPSDIYGGAVIAVTLKDLRSYACVSSNPEGQTINSQSYVAGTKRANAKIALEYSVIEQIELQYRHFSLEQATDIPKESGLAGSSAAAIAMIKAFNQHFGIGISNSVEVAELAWQAERKLRVAGGHDYYSIANDDYELPEQNIQKRIDDRKEKKPSDTPFSRIGKIFYMDFSGREQQRFSGSYSSIIQLPKTELPLCIVFSSENNKRSYSCHMRMRELFENDSRSSSMIMEFMGDSAKLARQGAQEFNKDKPSIKRIAALMTKSFENRLELMKKLKLDELNDESMKLKKILSRAGAFGITQPGSGSLCFIYHDEKPIKALEKEGYDIIKVCTQ